MSVKVFICYASEDETLREGLEKQLSPLRRQGLIDIWHDRKINAGLEWESLIDNHLNTAQIILLLISPDFVDSDYCYGAEIKRAMERHEQGKARVIPVILRYIYWQEMSFGKLKALPTNEKPIISGHWHNLDEAFFNVAMGILEVVKELEPVIERGTPNNFYDSPHTLIFPDRLIYSYARVSEQEGALVVFTDKELVSKKVELYRGFLTEPQFYASQNIQNVDILSYKVKSQKETGAVFSLIEPGNYTVKTSLKRITATVFAGEIVQIDWRKQQNRSGRHWQR